jgi:hypothetical protein
MQAINMTTIEDDTMKLMLKFMIPVEKGNSSVADGSLVKAITKLIKDVDAQDVYLFVENGQRAGIVIFDEEDSARMPLINEPFFAAVNASIEITPVTSLDALTKAI